jgi:glycosyltransferase involved in cell wall biosynthesis
MRDDFANRMWRLKQRIFAEIDVDVIVASQFMLDMVGRSPLTRHLSSVHLIPFGIDPAIYLPAVNQAKSRESLGIPADDFVLLFRSTASEFKGLPYILEALRSKPPIRPTTLITVDQKGLVNSLKSDYRVIELGWVEDQSDVRRMYAASDALLMPSTAEAFGLMALEAMASERPVITFAGTSLPWVTHAQECGIAVAKGDSAGLRNAIDLLASDRAEARRRGRLAREIASTVFSHDAYLDALAAVYLDVSKKRGQAIRTQGIPW